MLRGHMEKATELARKQAKIMYMAALFESCLCSKLKHQQRCFTFSAPWSNI